MRYLFGIITIISLISIGAILLADQKWDLAPGASYTIEVGSDSEVVEVLSAGKDKEMASLNCLSESAVKILQMRYKNFNCMPCSNGTIPEKKFLIKYPAEVAQPKFSENVIGGETIVFAKCETPFSSIAGSLTCSPCSDLEESE